MRTIQEIDRDLERTRQKLERARKLDVILKDLKAQSVRRRQVEEEARRTLEKEQGDVAELERMSLVSFLARLRGNLDARREEERREAALAKARYDAARWDLEDLEKRFREARREREKLGGQETIYQAFLDEKEAALRLLDSPQSQRLSQIVQALELAVGQLREVQEALQAGRRVLQALEVMAQNLDSAANLGTWDILGGGTLVTFAKQGCLDDAQDAAYEARKALSRFQNELADVAAEDIPDVSLDGLTAFADYFFDGLFADLFVQSRIQHAQNQTAAVTRQVQSLLYSLRRDWDSLEKQKERLEQEREALLAQETPPDALEEVLA